jgi:hypothetical protein
MKSASAQPAGLKSERIAASIRAAAACARPARKQSKDLCRPGFRRFTLDVPLEDHAKFKSACALHGTTLHAEICGFIRAAVAAPDLLLSETLFLEISPEFKTELLNYAAARRSSLGELLLDAFAQLQRQEPEVEVRPERRLQAAESDRRHIEVLRAPGRPPGINH